MNERILTFYGKDRNARLISTIKRVEKYGAYNPHVAESLKGMFG